MQREHEQRYRQRFIADPIHRSVELSELCVALMDTPSFQRMRDLRQLGLTWMVYPSGCHTRWAGVVAGRQPSSVAC
jgi:HD superfamily phosphohydrolase